MGSELLTLEEKQLVGRCLYEAANGSYFPDWEFETLIGADRSTVRKAAAQWLSGETIPIKYADVVVSVINNLLGYPHGRAAELEAAIGADMAKLNTLFEQLCARWRKGRGITP
jgi:hypothetical protein